MFGKASFEVVETFGMDCEFGSAVESVETIASCLGFSLFRSLVSAEDDGLLAAGTKRRKFCSRDIPFWATSSAARDWFWSGIDQMAWISLRPM